MASNQRPCLCGEVFDLTRFMIQCDVCRDWYHGSCVGVKEYYVMDIDQYHCPRCEPLCGPSTVKVPTNKHRHDRYELDADTKPVQTGTPVFIKELKSRHFASGDEIVVNLRGQQLALPYLHANGFSMPIVIEEKDGLDLKVPPDSFTAKDVELLVGSDRPIDVIDVTRQCDLKMKLSDFIEYYTNSTRTKTFNLISLEFSTTELSKFVEAPSIARKLDWANCMWPKDCECDEEESACRPCVQKYCLLGVKDCYTDFHIDFGGTSVWYHVLKGEKIFYLIRPTPANISLYQRWMTSSTQRDSFFGDQVDKCYKCVVKQGHTLLLPTGWIHAVLTPVDSLVFGGNFLHSLNIPLQLQVYEIERKIRTPDRFRYPSFETINWYAARKLLEELKCLNDAGTRCPLYILLGVRALITTLKQWSQDKESNKKRREEIPNSVDASQLLKDLNKEVRHAERYINTLNPPKPERESKRKKKKPINKDFVDLTHPLNLQGMREFSEKSPSKLSVKTLPKKLQVKHSNQSPLNQPAKASHPSLKLTLPKPVSYPYSTNMLYKKTCVIKKCDEDSDYYNASYDNQQKVGVISQVLSGENVIKCKSENPHEGFVKSELTGIPITKDLKPLLTYKHSESLKERLGAGDVKPNINESVYDFRDDSDEDCLVIDETPKKARHKGNSVPEYMTTFKVKYASGIPVINGSLEEVPDMDVAGEVDVISDFPKNGIDELLKASVYTEEEPTYVTSSEIEFGCQTVVESSMKVEECTISEEGPCLQREQSEGINSRSRDASPSTREAIAGMLSISRVVMTAAAKLSADQQHAPSRPKRRKFIIADDYGENVDKVYQDDEFIYPALDPVDDEDYIFKPRGKRRTDEAWNPKARVGPVTPKTDRPIREGTRKQAVERGLEAAAARRAGLPPPKRPYHKKKPKPVPEPQPGPSSGLSSSLLGLKRVDNKNRKPKKGMATAKQRLGKILKIHKMIH